MDRKLKILKAVLLLRRINKHESKEKQIADTEKHYSDEQLDEWIDMLKHPETTEPYKEPEETIESKEEHQTLYACNGDFSPAHPWDAPGMSIRDFI